jgi:hypothetical protein
MFDYSVSISTESFTITTGVYAETVKQAKRYAKDRILETAGLDVEDLEHEITVEAMGKI